TDQDTSDYLSLEVQYSQDATFATGVVSVKSSSISSTSNVGVSASVSASVGTPGVWYWRARAVDQVNLTSPWTTTMSFTIEYALTYSETNASSFSTGTLTNTAVKSS